MNRLKALSHGLLDYSPGSPERYLSEDGNPKAPGNLRCSPFLGLFEGHLELRGRELASEVENVFLPGAENERGG